MRVCQVRRFVIFENAFFLFLLAFLIAANGYSQAKACTHDTSPVLSTCEAEALNRGLADIKSTFDFSGKKVLFVTKDDASEIITKKKFFDFIKLHHGKYDGVTGLAELTAKEKETSGGYDIIVMYYVTKFDKERKAKLIEEVKLK
ncbi:MAG TPA: hypothetical protein VD905_13260 [Flavobacteriales bacterium]|nr:hypothetical protein [Flavobacteriales bacterium]